MPEYKMPEVGLGPAVWRQQPGGEPFAAIITRVLGRCVCLTVFPHEGAMFFRKDVVRHSSDPDLKRLVTNDGCWDYTDSDETLRTLAS